ncbi:MAG: DUF5615 family PIN-like protein [Promethearchaeota archaeon]
MDLKKLQFLLDENVPVGLLKILRSFDIKCTTVQELGWNGFKDIEIAKKISNTKRIFLTRDKDFQFLWEKFDLRVIHLMIDPTILEYISPTVEKLLQQWNFDIYYPFLLIVQNESYRFRQKLDSPQ